MKKIQYILLSILFLAGCSGDGIFYSLENEEEIIDANNLSETASLDQILVYNGNYVLNGKSIWHSTRTTETQAWSTYSDPAGYESDATYPSIALMNGDLYATVMSIDDGYRSGLIKYNSTTSQWDELYHTTGSNASYNNMYLFQTDQGLYLNVVKYYLDANYDPDISDSELYFYEDDAAWGTSDPFTNYKVTFPDSADLNLPITEIISASGNNIYMVYNTSVSDLTSGVVCVADGSSDPRTFSAESTGLSSSYNYSSIYYTDLQGGMLFVGTKADDDTHPILYKYGSSWDTIDGGDDIQFSSFCDISAIQDNTILAGTNAFVYSSSSYLGDGYYEIILDDPTDPAMQENNFSDGNNYDSSDLADATIKDFYYDSYYMRLYATTTCYGLWMNDITQLTWTQE